MKKCFLDSACLMEQSERQVADIGMCSMNRDIQIRYEGWVGYVDCVANAARCIVGDGQIRCMADGVKGNEALEHYENFALKPIFRTLL